MNGNDAASSSNGASSTAVAEIDESTVDRAVGSVEELDAALATNIPAGLAKKLAEATKGVEAVAKSGKNNDQNYTYVQAEDVINAASKALSNAGLIVPSPEHVKAPKFDDLASRSGSGGKFCTVELLFKLVDGETGESVAYRRFGTATDYPGDKAIYKAETGATKYFFSSLLSMYTGLEDPEVTVHGGGKNNSSGGGGGGAASDGQKKFFKDLLDGKEGKNLPPEARKAIINAIGGKSPTKSGISSAIEALKDGKGLEFAKESGWDGEVQATAAPASAAEGTAKAPEAGIAPEPKRPELLELCKTHKRSSDQIITCLKALGADIPSDIGREQLASTLHHLTDEDAERFKKMLVSSAASEKASQAATETQPDSESSTQEATPDTALSDLARKALDVAEEVGFSQQFPNLIEFFFDTREISELSISQLEQSISIVKRVQAADVNSGTLDACLRRGLTSDEETEARCELFGNWIAEREADQVAEAAAELAAEQAEGPQE